MAGKKVESSCGTCAAFRPCMATVAPGMGTCSARTKTAYSTWLDGDLNFYEQDYQVKELVAKGFVCEQYDEAAK